MPLKIRCPHCHKVLVAEDDAAGRRKRCPACKQPFNVPLPVSDRTTVTDVASRCPRCGAETAPGTTVCPKCHSDTTTGKRLPLHRRLPLISVKTWTITGLSIIGAALLIYVGVQVYLARFLGSRPEALAFRPVPKTPFPAAEWTARLFAAHSPADRRSAYDKLVLGGVNAPTDVAGAVAAGLGASLTDADQSLATTRQRLAAIDILGRTADDEPGALDKFGPLLAACQQDPALNEAAWCARAMLGDAGTLDHLHGSWLRDQRRLIFLTRLAQLANRQDPAMGRVIQHTADDVDRAARALVRLKHGDEQGVLARLLPGYWESWSWLGQVRGTKLAAALFQLAQARWNAPEADIHGFEGEQRAIRDACDALLRVSGSAAPAARAAASVVLTQSAPQFRPARADIIADLVAVLPECEPPTQQLLTWTIVRLTGRQFGQASGRSLPAEVRAGDIAAMLRWARSNGMAAEAPLTTPAEAYPHPPALSYRVVPRVRQLERDLLERLRQGWSAAAGAMDQWSEADIGCTPNLLQLLDPAQRAPDYPALAAAIVIVAECNQQSARPALALWRQATDQPAWVRQLAYAALGALDARTGRWTSGWPAGFTLGPRDQLDRGQPGWDHFARILAAGGPAMIARTKSYKPAPLEPELRNRLLEAAAHAARRRALEERP